MAYTTINKSTDHFNTVTYTGNGSVGTALTTGTFQPDLTWFKNRGTTESHMWMDAVRGATNYIQSNSTAAQGTSSDKISAFTSTGVTLGSGAETNENSQPLVCWSWKAGTGQGSSNTDGSINTTYTSANTTSGFSISSYTGTGSNATIGHGLGVKPSMIICKKLNTTGSWITYHSALGATKYLYLNATDAEAANSTVWQDTEPTTPVFSVGSASNCNDSGATYVAYCFAEKKGFSKFGSYVGSGNANGPFVYTGFKPAFFLWKRHNSTGGWYIADNKRSPFNLVDIILGPNDSNKESAFGTVQNFDFCSNGIKLRGTNVDSNYDGGQYIYIAFAEAPLVSSNGVPATAR